MQFVRHARRALDEHGPFNRIIAHWLVPSGYPIALGGSTPVEVVAHGSDVRLLLRAPTRLRSLVVGRLLERAQSFRFVSSELLTDLARAVDRDLGERLVEKSHVAPAEIDLGARLDRAQARAALGIAPSKRIALLVARLIPSKRVAVALRSAALLPRAEVVVIGDGPELERLRDELPAAHFLGKLPRSETLAWIAAADVLLSASRQEGAPTVVREARALDTPVVSVTSGAVRAWAETDPDIWLVD